MSTSASTSGSPAAEAAAPARTDAEKRAATRRKVFEEIISSEEVYVHKLEWAIKHYVRPIRALGLLDDADLSLLFSNLDMLLKLNQDLLSQLRLVGPVGEIGRVFATAAPTLRMYSVYVNNYPMALALLGRLAGDDDWQRFTDTMGGDSLESTLITPVQRICRYELLLREAVRHTDGETDPETLASLREALELVGAIATLINAKKAEHERVQRVLEIQRQFSAAPEIRELVQPSRRFVRQDQLVKKPTDKGGGGSELSVGKRRLLRALGQRRERLRWFFLFSDIIVYASVSRITGKFEFRGRIALEGATIAPLPDSADKDLRAAFEISTPTGRFVAQCESPAERDGYVRDVRALILELIQQGQRRRRDVT
jgi:hypothetical protein